MKTKNSLLYVCSPYRGNTKRNKEYARELTRLAIENGFIPVTVHLYLTEVLDDEKPKERANGMFMGKVILENCKFILIGRRYGISEGMAAEMERAAELGLVRLYERNGGLYIEDPADKLGIEEKKQNWDDLTEAEKFKEVFKAQVSRDGSAALLDYLETAGFFTAPAGMKHHGAFPGGLVAHSNNVYRRLVALNTEESRKAGPIQRAAYSNETLAVAALLHDVCKMDVYHLEEKDGQQSYSYNDPLPLGHGEKSVYMITRFMQLTPEEALAIRWHMGAYDKAAQADLRDLDKAQKHCKLATMLHLADMMATHFDEAEG